MSYSNWGTVFTDTTLKIANRLRRFAENDSRLLFLVEVTPRLLPKKTGSLLVAASDHPTELKLVKYGYGRGAPKHSTDLYTLMSINTWYVSIPNLLNRLRSFSTAVSRADEGCALLELLADASEGERREELSGLFDSFISRRTELSCQFARWRAAFPEGGTRSGSVEFALRRCRRSKRCR